MKPIVITGTKRAGTAYIAALITCSGYWCSHERHFRGSKRFKLRPSTIESSFAAAPFLSGLDAHIIHQVRHPLLVVASMMARGDFTKMKSAWTPEVCPQSIQRGDDRLAKCLRFWLEWNRMVEPHADRRWRFDDVSHFDVAAALSEYGRPVDASRVGIAAAVLPDRINQGHSVSSLSWDGIPDGQLKQDVLSKAKEYGYIV